MLVGRFATYGNERAARYRNAPSELVRVVDEVRRNFAIPAVAEKAGVRLKARGREWVGLCPFHNERTPSFTVYDEGRKFCCFGCRASGDVLDFVQQAYGVKLFEAIDMLDSGALAELRQQLPPPRPKQDLRPVADRIVREAVPIEGTPAAAYLRSRGITMPLPHTLRFARLAPPKQPEDNGLLAANGSTPLPCLVAVVTDPAGQLVGIQRTYLTEDGRKAATTDGKVKYSLGNLIGGAIQLGPPAETIVVTEGLEDGLSLAQSLGESVWVAAGTKMLPHMQFPEVTRSVIIGADRDEPGERAAQAAAEAYRGRGLSVTIARPDAPFKDWNDQLRGVAA
ncbi:DNA primase [Sphingomonas jinjuensis]|uniref:DNA primase n=1 Tax=Sphingomonas jinjuensis TaxID=535907 RepID=A0A840FIT3_9SPHN|nr:CHC2 zinc finger domain-containing protein [Sphingomonas jinjuensis]MBB4153255.1 DNA primase [Sphingomonas jinjuensis]